MKFNYPQSQSQNAKNHRFFDSGIKRNRKSVLLYRNRFLSLGANNRNRIDLQSQSQIESFHEINEYRSSSRPLNSPLRYTNI
jgi:hypothetical protein